MTECPVAMLMSFAVPHNSQGPWIKKTYIVQRHWVSSVPCSIQEKLFTRMGLSLANRSMPIDLSASRKEKEDILIY